MENARADDSAGRSLCQGHTAQHEYVRRIQPRRLRERRNARNPPLEIGDYDHAVTLYERPFAKHSVLIILDLAVSADGKYAAFNFHNPVETVLLDLAAKATRRTWSEASNLVPIFVARCCSCRRTPVVRRLFALLRRMGR